MIRKLRWVFYSIFFVFAFFVSSYLVFPIDAIKEYIVVKMEDSLRRGRSFGPGPDLTVQDISLWRLSGVRLDGVRIDLPSNGFISSWQFDWLKARVGIFSALRGQQRYEFDSSLYGGRLGGAIASNKKQEFTQLSIDISRIDLAKLQQSFASKDLPLTGLVTLHVDLRPAKLPKDSRGDLAIAFDNMSIGPGQIVLPGSGFASGLTVPKINLGKLTGKMLIKNGVGKSEGLSLSGGDVEGQSDIQMELRESIARSSLSGEGWFKIKEQFLAKNPNVQALLDLTPNIKRATDDQGRVHFSINGSVDRPGIRLKDARK